MKTYGAVLNIQKNLGECRTLEDLENFAEGLLAVAQHFKNLGVTLSATSSDPENDVFYFVTNSKEVAENMSIFHEEEEG